MRSRRVHVVTTAALAASWAFAIADGCSAVSAPNHLVGTGGDPATTTSVTIKASGGAPTTTSAGTGTGGGFTFADADAGDASDAAEEPLVNPCGSQCGPTELCDPAHIGLDDNCNGLVDEGCGCTPGAVHWCFRGDPSYRNTPGCFDGTETCSEIGIWGPCVGGVGASPPDNCFISNTMCHAITAVPGATVDLETGTGLFSADAVPGSETFTVACPAGVSQCPSVAPPASFSEIQSGEYTVTYTKMVSGSSMPQSCTFPLFIGARGLRIELSWEHYLTDEGVDLDLHLHQPVSTLPWAISPGAPQDCTWSSCKIDQIEVNDPDVPKWFTGVSPAPCAWDVETSAQSLDNTCYNDPRGVGAEWRALNEGCHNPRQDIDNIQCNFSISDPTNPEWCGPEVDNVDYPPQNQWFRVGVHYYYNHGRTYDVHPEIKIFCNGALSADLGPESYYMPGAPVTFAPADGAGVGTGNRFWIAADVAFTTDSCNNVICTVAPIYADPTNLTPLLTLDTAATQTFAPAWPPPPQ
jgi:hypothetical protein